MNREGLPTIIGLAAFTAFLIWFSLTYDLVLFKLLSGIALVLTLFSICFFRDPKRTPPDNPNIVVSPADGTVIAIETVTETEYINGRVHKVAIFMSLFNVHVNYVPFQGTVDFMRYYRGKFLRANLPEASTHNVHILTGLQTPRGKVAFKQATGLVARRLVNHLRPGDTVTTGQKFGIIKFGSRMEVFLPLYAAITVNIGDRVKAGVTIIAEFHE